MIFCKFRISTINNLYNYIICIKYNQNPGYLILQQYHESFINNSDPLYLITCELDLTSTPFCDTKILTYEIELPPSGNKIGLDGEYFTIPSVIDKIPNSPASHKLPTQYKKNVWIIAIN